VITSELIARSLRLINEPGKGATLSPDDQSDAFDALQGLLDSEAVSRLFVPGISTHFFNLVSGQANYTYGADPARSLRSDNFGSLETGLGDPAPTYIESAYLRLGGTITDNELVDQWRFEATGTWSVDADADVVITNNQYKVETPAGATSSTVALAGMVQGRQYRLRVDAVVTAGDIDIELREGATEFDTLTIDSSGFYTLDFTWSSTVVTPDINLATDATTDDIRLNSVSLMDLTATERLTLGPGSDLPIKIITQDRYNSRATKHSGGTPEDLLYTRSEGEVGNLRLDVQAVSGQILVMDVLVNRARVTRLEDSIRLNSAGIRYLRYALANEVAGEYGKALTRAQLDILDDAWNNLASSNRRNNTLRVDPALMMGRGRGRGSFNINRGD